MRKSYVYIPWLSDRYWDTENLNLHCATSLKPWVSRMKEQIPNTTLPSQYWYTAAEDTKQITWRKRISNISIIYARNVLRNLNMYQCV